MGAANSTPTTPDSSRTVGAPIQVTATVINRLKNAKQQSSGTEAHSPARVETPCNCGNNATAKPKMESDLLQLKTTELEESQFLKTIEKLDTMLGKPIQWTEYCMDDVLALRKQVIQCYHEYPREPLRCSEVSKQFQNLIFTEQYKSILLNKGIEEDDCGCGDM